MTGSAPSIPPNDRTIPFDAAAVLQNVPACLRERAQWMCWRYVKGKRKPRKVPVNPKSGCFASATNPQNWGTFDEVLSAVCCDRTLAGVGFVFTSGDPFAGIDLDGCIVNGVISPGARAIIDSFGSYTERSPSGEGVKIFVQATKPAGAACWSDHVDDFDHVEIYDDKRFFVVTGACLDDLPRSVEVRQDQMDALCGRLWGRQHAAPAHVNGRHPDPRSPRTDATDPERLCIAYLARCPDAISGKGGHKATLRAACECFRFGLDDAAAWRVMSWFNETKCGGELWNEKELTHKLESARKKVTAKGDFGCRLRSGTGVDALVSDRVASINSDVGNAARLVRRFNGNFRFCYGPNHWLVWDGKRWSFDGDGQVVRLCKSTALAIMKEAASAVGDRQRELAKWALVSQKRDRLTAMAALAQPEVAVRPDELDADPWALNCLNGTIDLRTGTLRPHRRADLITKLAPVTYDPAAVCPLFEAFLARTFDGNAELMRYVQRWLGHCLTGDVSEQYLMVYHGEGNNGKNVLLDTVATIMGDYAGEAPPDLVTLRGRPDHPTEIADLMGKRLVIASETECGAELRLQLIKRLTGNARLKARKMRQDYFEFKRTHKLVLVTNNKPVVREDTEAAWRRIRLVPFGVVIPKAERDPQLTEKLRSELPGILGWLVRGCIDWVREGLAEPQEVIVATEDYRGTANSLDTFLAQCCSLGLGRFCTSSSLTAAYLEWCGRTGMVPLRTTAFGEEMKKHGCLPKKVSGHRGWLGVSVRDDAGGTEWT